MNCEPGRAGGQARIDVLDGFPADASPSRAETPDVTAAPGAPVWSCNEWDPLEEVIVGRLEGATIPSDHVTVTWLDGIVAPSSRPTMTSSSGSHSLQDHTGASGAGRTADERLASAGNPSKTSGRACASARPGSQFMSCRVPRSVGAGRSRDAITGKE